MLNLPNIEAELSYAYLHAVASRAGFACEYTTRHMDAVAVDAIVREDGRLLAADSVLSSFAVHFQLKATFQHLNEIDGRFPFSLPLHQYNRLREPNIQTPRLLVVLLLPSDANEWLQHSEESLVARKCAYWVSLRGAPASANETTQTVYLPRAQRLSPSSLTDLMTRFSRQEEMGYAT